MPTYHFITEDSPLLHDANCIYCHVDLVLNDDVVVCDFCQSPHHEDCWQANSSRCATFGCVGTDSRLENITVEPIRDSTRQAIQSRIWFKTLQQHWQLNPTLLSIIAIGLSLIVITGLYPFLSQPTVTVLGSPREINIEFSFLQFPVNSVSWSPDGTLVASGSWDGMVRIWDVARGEEVSHLRGQGPSINSVSWSPDGSQIVSGSTDQTVQIWDVASGEEVSILRHRFRINSVSWSPDGSQVAFASNLTVRIWDVASGEIVRVLPGHDGSIVNSVSWSPDGGQLVSGAGDDTVRIWDVARGKEVSILRGHTKSVNGVSWSPDGTQVASGSLDGSVRIWDVASGMTVSRLRGKGSSVSSVSWSPDGSKVTADFDNYYTVDVDLGGVVHIWDVVGGEVVSHLSVDKSGIKSVSWSPDGSRIAFGTSDSTVRIWEPE